MAKIEVYSTDYCPYCTRAKDLLKRKGAEFTEYDVTHDEEGRVKLVEKSGGQRTVPQ
ncbi:MAG: glutaredoxin, partial [Flavobacteriales bacterium CG11_big_fil_rev_8_21_14_0_20_35_7]